MVRCTIELDVETNIEDMNITKHKNSKGHGGSEIMGDGNVIIDFNKEGDVIHIEVLK